MSFLHLGWDVASSSRLSSESLKGGGASGSSIAKVFCFKQTSSLSNKELLRSSMLQMLPKQVEVRVHHYIAGVWYSLQMSQILGWTDLHHAAMEGRLSSIKKSVESCSFDVHISSANSWTPLHYAAAYNQVPAMLTAHVVVCPIEI